ncbi:MAG: amidohydrolase family protein [Bacteroidota bacterium]
MKITTLLLLFLFITPYIFAQDNLSDGVRAYVTHDRSNYVLQNAILIDGSGNPAKRGVDILVKGDRIEKVGIDLSVPDGYQVVDLNGKSVMPGMIMLHEHLFYPTATPGKWGVNQMSYSFPRLYLAGGITTMRTAGSIMPEADLNIKKAINRGQAIGPKMDVTSPFIDREGTQLFELGTISSPQEAEQLVNFWADRGVTSFKVYNFIKKDDLKAVVKAAHARKLKVTGHLCSVTYEEAADLGIDNLEHGFFASSDFQKDKEPDLCNPFEARKSRLDEPISSKKVTKLIDHLVRKNVALTSTINVFEPYTGREVVPGGGIDALYTGAKEKVYRRWTSKQGRDSIDYHAFNQAKAWEKAFYDAGGLLVAGTDPTYDGRIVAGYANMRLLELFTEMGFSIPEAIKICTLNGAKYLKLESETGTVEEGKVADLLIIDGDISQDIGEIRNIQTVFKNGIGYDSKKLFDETKGFVGIR